MLYRIFTDVIIIVHFAFVPFVVFGGFFVLWSRRIAWIHIPALMWGILIEFSGWICPLTPLEIWCRQRGGLHTYESGFIERYILPLLYPAELTRGVQILMGVLLTGINLGIYWWAWHRIRQRCKNIL
ncbi:hypothetical protein U27_02258 [Candidatus Vecturithrix granuli]|uniref:DUF2784 domain-containing protein n=1 Tax=Vecturithrix granuli TaxID=1499967 RepID=A0A0S6WAT5_VECG1|nr:hypothetical protein U27_02258 [Candidatus Vecturithrix granuli]